MRVVSLVPSATEMLFALGAGDGVIAVTHECDYPLEALALPRVTRDVIPHGLAAAEVDAAVRELTEAGRSIYELDEDLLADLRPDLIVTQALCAVCAVSYEDVRAVAQRLDSHPQVVSLDPRTVGEVLGDAHTLGDAVGRPEAGVELAREAADRIDRVRAAVAGARRPRVVALEWLDPVFVAGHWTPQLIDYAGGEDVLGAAGEHSEVRSWEQVAAARPDVVVAMPCGYDAARSEQEARSHREELAGVGAGQVVAVDAAAHFSRPGPRLVDGLELLAHFLHPELVAEPAAVAIEVEVEVAP